MPGPANPKTNIRLAGKHDLKKVISLSQQCAAQAGPGKTRRPFVFTADTGRGQTILRERILDRCLLVAERQERLLAAAGIDLDRSALGELMITAEGDSGSIFKSLIAATERRAVAFELRVLTIRLFSADERRFRSLGFVVDSRQQAANEPADVSSATTQSYMRRSLRRRQTVYGRRIRALAEELGIPTDYSRKHRLALQPEATKLATIGADVFGREQKLGPRAATAWRRLQRAALDSGIELQAVSAWRPVSYQVALLQRKLDKGLNMDEILKVSAAPGFSEHHTGRAIDIATPGFAVLEEEFERSPAFRWMELCAGEYGFSLSFPRDNRHRLAYEPWHWRFDG